jgi:GDP-D-mannose dehydratase
MKRVLSGLLLVITLTACASTGEPRAPRASRNVLTYEEISRSNASTAFEAIRQLRPEYLRTRGAQSVQNPSAEYAVVYVNGVRAGDLGMLHSIRATDIQEVRYMNASEATTRYGTGHAGGVIEVRTRT